MDSDFGGKAGRKQSTRAREVYVKERYLEKDEKGTSERNCRGLDSAYP